MNRFSRFLTAASAAALLLAAGPEAARAQVPAVDVRIVPRAGFYAPLDSLREIPGQVERWTQDKGGVLALGANAEIGILLVPFDFRATVMYGTGNEVSLEQNGSTERTDASVLTLSGDVLFRPLPRILVQPYLIGGAGYKSVSYDRETLSRQFRQTFPEEEESQFTLHGGVGADVNLGGTRISVEISDFLSGAFSGRETQHDVFTTVGVGLTLF